MLRGIMSMRRTQSFFVLCMFFVVTILPQISLAQQSGDFSFTPVLIDEKAKPRDILKQTLTIVNTSNRKLNLYPSVNNIDPAEGQQEFAQAHNGTDRAASLANWIELSRGVIELGPGEEKTVPFVIRVNLTAVPGSYHAYISFYEGSTRESAEKTTALGKMTVNVEVLADVKEVMQLNKFFSDNIFFSGDDVLFNYQLENIGNQSLQPKGEIRVYDRKGREVAAVEVNKDGKTISPDEISQLASVWSAATGFGKYKAFINVDYGESQKASVQDTVFFWIIPWQQLVGMLVTSLMAIVFLALYVHRRMDARFHARLAHAGLHTDTKESLPVTPRTPVESQSDEGVKKSRLSFLRRSKTKELTETAVPLEAPSKRPRNQMLEALGAERIHAPQARHEAVRPQGGTIDLKQMSTPSPRKPQTTHVINLKNES